MHARRVLQDAWGRNRRLSHTQKVAAITILSVTSYVKDVGSDEGVGGAVQN